MSFLSFLVVWIHVSLQINWYFCSSFLSTSFLHHSAFLMVFLDDLIATNSNKVPLNSKSNLVVQFLRIQNAQIRNFFSIVFLIYLGSLLFAFQCWLVVL